MIGLIIVFALALRLISLNQSFWLDETAQAVLSAKPIMSVNYAADFQPPLFYVMSHFWIALGDLLGTRAELFLRLPSVFFSVLTVYLIYVFMKEVLGKRVGMLAALFLATAPFHIYYAQEFRMYSLLTVFGVISWMLLWRKKWLGYVVISILSLFTHYFAFIILFSQAVFVVITDRKSWKQFFISVSIVLITFAPWVSTLLQQVKTSKSLLGAWPSWAEISNIGFYKLPGLILAKFTVGMIRPENRLMYAGAVAVAGIILIISLVGIFLHRKTLKAGRRTLVLLICASLLPLLAAWIGGLFISASTPWRIQFVLPFYYAIIAFGLYQWDKTKTRKVFLIASSLLVAVNICFSTQYLLVQTNHREDWKEAIAYSDSIIGNNDLVLAEYIGPWAPMEWYSKKYANYRGASTTPAITTDSTKSQLDSLIEAQKPSKIVLYTYLFTISDPNQHVNAYLLDHGYTLTQEKDFRGVGIIKTYEIDQSKLTNEVSNKPTSTD